MTPQEVFEYKRSWLPGIRVTLHSDLRSQGIGWCKLFMNPIHWKHEKWTGPYQDTFYFKKMSHAKGLAEKFPQYARIVDDQLEERT